MKCISLMQPWASLVVIGAKHYETRSWATSYRGPLLIHASKRFSREDIERGLQEPFRSALATYPKASGGTTLRDLPLGAIIGKVDLVRCLHIDRNPFTTQLGCLSEREIGEPERSFGDFTPGRYAWKLANPVRFEAPIPWKGQLGLYDVRPEYLGVTKEVMDYL